VVDLPLVAFHWRPYFLRGIGLERTGVFGIVGVCATFWKKLDPDALFGAILILFTGAGLAFSLDATGRMGGFAAVDVLFADVVEAAGVVVGAMEVAAGLSTLVLEISLALVSLYGLAIGSFSKATIRLGVINTYHKLHTPSSAKTPIVLSKLPLAKSTTVQYSAHLSSLKVLEVCPI